MDHMVWTLNTRISVNIGGITLRFHKIILNGRGHVFCVCFDFSRPFFSLRLFHNPAVHNHNPKLLVWLLPIRSILWRKYLAIVHLEVLCSHWSSGHWCQFWCLENGVDGGVALNHGSAEHVEKLLLVFPRLNLPLLNALLLLTPPVSLPLKVK